ncbi:MAG: PQQ-binding-like beta-propeller repeat protein, partial [Hyphomicrobiales bacterium]|nr:PQQ-binding-like beta-propeller repeat protein [Hyphomicrobiales bacterium]
MKRCCNDGFRWLACLSLAAVVGACSGSLNPFKKEEERLPGQRISISKPQNDVQVDPIAARKPVSISAPQRNTDWSQPGGVATNAPGHLQVSGGLGTSWRADVGEGSSDKGRLTASPIVYQGKIFAIDTRGRVAAFSASGGGRVWRVDLAPENEKGEEGFGGGLAVDEGRLYATTGFGTAVALNPANGEVLWTRNIGTPVRSSPTAVGGKLYFVSADSRLFCLSGKDGADVWTYR